MFAFTDGNRLAFSWPITFARFDGKSPIYEKNRKTINKTIYRYETRAAFVHSKKVVVVVVVVVVDET